MYNTLLLPCGRSRFLQRRHPVGTIVVERKHFTCPSWESNPGRWIYRQTLYNVAVKAGIYLKAVEVCYTPSPMTFMTNGSLMKVKSIAECSYWSILKYFGPRLSEISLKNQFLVFLRVAVYTGFTVFLQETLILCRFLWKFKQNLFMKACTCIHT